MAGEGEGHFAIVVLLATAGSHLKNTKLLKERSKKPRWTGDCRCRGRLYPELCVILRQEQGICFLRAFNSMSRIVRPNHRLGGDYTCIPACTHEHTFVSDGGGWRWNWCTSLLFNSFHDKNNCQVGFCQSSQRSYRSNAWQGHLLVQNLHDMKIRRQFFQGGSLSKTNTNTHPCMCTHTCTHTTR